MTDQFLKDCINAVPETVSIEAHPGEGKYLLLGNEVVAIEHSQKVWNKSQEFSWGYSGSGPAQTSLAILLEVLPYKVALKMFQNFKFRIVSKWPQNEIVKVKLSLRAVLLELYEQKQTSEIKYDS